MQFKRNPITQINKHLFLGNVLSASNYDILKANDIKIIINVTSEVPNYYPKDFSYVNIKIPDNGKAPIKPYLENTYNLIKKEEAKSNNILVHCMVGGSRSASIIIYYLLRENPNLTYQKAVKLLRKNRPIVNPTIFLMNDVVESLK